MVTINNSRLTKELIDGAKIQTARESVPGELGKTVVPVMEVNPRMLTRGNILKGRIGGPGVIYTTPTDKDFYLCGVGIAMVKAVGETGTNCQIRLVNPDGVTENILHIPGITLTAERGEQSLSICPPMKLARGANISTVGSNIANMSGTAFGYTEDD